MRDNDVPIPVLLVDSHAGRASGLEGALESIGFEPWRCSSAVEACRRAAAGPCLALISVDDARRSGWSLLRFLVDDLGARVPLVVFSEEELDDSAKEVLDDLAVRAIQIAAEWRRGDKPEQLLAGLDRGLSTLLDSAGRDLLLLDNEPGRAHLSWLRELRAGGIRVHAASRPEEVADYVAGQVHVRAPELVVLRDVPSIVGHDSGPQAWATLTRQTRCVVLADEERTDRRTAWLQAGAAAYLVEPVDPASLYLALGLRAPRERVEDRVLDSNQGATTQPSAALPRISDLLPQASGSTNNLGLLWIRTDGERKLREWNTAARLRYAGGHEPPSEWCLEDLFEDASLREQLRDVPREPPGGGPARGLDLGLCRLRGEGSAFLEVHLWPQEGDGWVLTALEPAAREALVRASSTEAAVSRYLGMADAAVPGESFLLMGLDETLTLSVSEEPEWSELESGQTVLSRIPAADCATFRSAWREAVGGKPSQLSHRVSEPGGGPDVWSQTRFFPLASDGKVIAVGALSRRVGRGGTHALNPRRPDPISNSQPEPQPRLSELVTSAPAVLFDVDPTGKLVRRQAHQPTGDGIALGPVQGSVFEPFGDVPELVETIRSALSGRTREISLEVAGRTLEVHMSPFQGARGSIAGVNGVAIDVSDRVRAQSRFEAVVEATSSVVGQGFFRNLVRTLTRSLGVRLAYISSLSEAESRPHLRMLSLWSGGEYSEDYSYPVPGTPDELVLTDGRAYFPNGIHHRFGENPWIRQQGVQSFLGVAIRDSAGQSIGVLGVMHTGPLDEQQETESMLRVFASRAGVEIERLGREARLQESESRWRSVVENAPEVVATIDRDCGVLFANRTLEGREPKLLVELLGDFDTTAFDAAASLVFSDGKARSVVLEARARDGERRWYDCRIGPTSAEGPCETAIVLATDTTARKTAELGLEARVRVEQWIREVSTRFINMSLDELDSGLARALEQVAEVCGFDRAYVFQLDPADTALERTHQWVSEGSPDFLERIGEQTPLGLGWVLPRIRSGKDVYVPAVARLGEDFAREREQLLALGLSSFGGFPMTCGGQLLGLFGFDRLDSELVWDREMAALMRIVADVFASTLARKQAEQERRELEERLRQSQKLKAITTLAGGIAHDFNQILMGVRGQAELLRENMSGQSAAQRVASVLDTAAERGAELTRKVLEFARETPPKESTEPTCLHNIVEEVCSLLQHSLEKTIDVERELSAERSHLIGDRGALQQLVMNLAVNARDAMEAGGELRFTTHDFHLQRSEAHRYPELEPGDYIRLDVRDTGCGMERETLERIFEPFFTTKEQGKGTGLGLSAAYGVVRKHGGTLRVDSQVGEGTCFSLWFPVSAAVDRPAPVKAPLPAVRGHGLVLLVDDEQIVRLTATALLESIGYEVLVASNGVEAVELFSQRSEEIDVVLLDLIMPEMDGRECFAAMRKIDARVPIVLSSGWGYETARQDFPEEGLAGLITKPYPSIGEFSRILAGAIAKRGRDEDEEEELIGGVLQPEPKRPLSEHVARLRPMTEES